MPDTVNKLPKGVHLAYLDVWERHITAAEDKGLAADKRIPGIREVALGGADTTTRTQLVWQVRLAQADGRFKTNAEVEEGVKLLRETISRVDWHKLLADLNVPTRPGSGLLSARVDPGQPASLDPCIIAPDARYRGAENQLYRVEVHTTGPIGEATFKWSRENGSVIFPILQLRGTIAELVALGRDDRLDLAEGDFVEVITDTTTLRGLPGPICKVSKIDRGELRVTLEPSPNLTVRDGQDHALLRRWDQKERAGEQPQHLERDGCVRLTEGDKDADWITLEDGVQVRFSPPDGKTPRVYRTGDYWLIPARTATGDIEWPQASLGGELAAQALPPFGVDHHYAPLGFVTVGDDGKPRNIKDCRRAFKQLGLP